MTRIPEEGLKWQGPVVWWNPVEGFRHAFAPTRRPYPGQERDTLCEQQVTLIEPSDVDWLLPTCDTCMSHARTRLERRRNDITDHDERERRRRRLEGDE